MNPIPDADTDADEPLSAALLRQLVDALDFGAMLLEPCGRIRWANRPARLALSLGDVLGVVDERLSLHGPQQQRALARALAEAAAGGTRMLCLGGGVPSTKLGLAPWGHDTDGTALLLGTLQTGEREQWPALRAYARERRLTEGETDVLQQLVLGDRPPQIAVRRGSSEGTVRSQIKTLLEKTGTHSMRELVVEALHLPPMPAGIAMRAGPGPGPRSGAGAGVPQAAPPVPLRAAVPTSSATTGAAVSTPGRETSPAAADAPRSPLVERRAVRGARRATGMPDRGALLALVARQFAWPPAA